MQYNTAGVPMPFFEMCAHCNMNTGGQHEPYCPLSQPHLEPTQEPPKVRVRILKFDENGNFIKEF